MLRETLFVFAALLALSAATNVEPCPDESSVDEVEVSDCDGAPCILKKGTTKKVVIKFQPERDLNELKTRVSANIVGVNLPFIGVDGTDACNDVYDAHGQKVKCPLKKGETYVYKNQFNVLQLYPTLTVGVTYALADSAGDVTCFTLQSKITK